MRLHSVLFVCLVSLTLGSELHSAKRVPAERYFLVQAGSGAEVRGSNEPGAEITDSPPAGELLVVAEKMERSGETVYRVDLPSGREGFLSSFEVQREFHDSDPECRRLESPGLICVPPGVEAVPIRRSPSTRAPVITEIWPGERIWVYGLVLVGQGTWYEVGVSWGGYWEKGWIVDLTDSLRLLRDFESPLCPDGKAHFNEGHHYPVWIFADSANLRERPDHESPVIKTGRVADLLIAGLEDKYGLDKIPDDRWISVKWRSEGAYASAWLQRKFLSADDEPARRKAYVEKHDLPSDYRAAILDGRILYGMTKGMVEASWGSQYLAELDGATEIWIMGDFGPKLSFESGVLTGCDDYGMGNRCP